MPWRLAAWRETEDLLASVPGVGPTIARTLIAELPELGTLDRKQIAALAGLAPHTRQSGQWKGRSFIGGGRRPYARPCSWAPWWARSTTPCSGLASSAWSLPANPRWWPSSPWPGSFSPSSTPSCAHRQPWRQPARTSPYLSEPQLVSFAPNGRPSVAQRGWRPILLVSSDGSCYHAKALDFQDSRSPRFYGREGRGEGSNKRRSKRLPLTLTLSPF